MNDTTTLIVRNDGLRQISFTDQANELKSAALEKSALIAKVANADEQTVAVEAQQELATLAKQVEKARVAAKEPVLKFGQLIDAQAKAFIAEVATEQMRLAKLVGDFQQLEAAKAQAAEHARQLEAERIAREEREEQQRILRAEAERLAVIRRREEQLALEQKQREEAAKAEADEAARKVREATGAAARKKAEAEAAEQKRVRDIADAKAAEEARRAAVELKRQEELAQASTHAELDAAQERASNAQAAIDAATPAAPVRAEGQRVTNDWEVTVSDIWLLAKAHPVCVKIEPQLREIKSLLNAGVKVAGVTATKVVKSSVTTKRVPGAIDV